jgi:hypothetical protein
MSALNWLLIILFSNVFLGYCMYDLGHRMGIEQQKINAKARLASMHRHPSSGIRSVE